ncbi:hypothetical protein [Ensifer sp. LCM 4579]|uniref:hypothetical protein n=1 Tax=Ensifer sp. LCM 4579 TaxID=1848292 RepID=UPI0008DB1235|nr:hypothetical protein [Ensifer sp. LCM 4579]OHV76823.1 hypothetical protein LCM4579_27400 [Ensifer sp. LCM 4579]
MNIHRTFALDSDLTFEVLERPPVGAVRIFGRAGEARELLLLAENQTSAETWLKAHRYPGPVMDEVTTDEVAAADVKGRAA